MRKIYQLLVAAVICLLGSSSSFAQNNLAAGDLAIVSYQSDPDPTNTFNPALLEFDDRFSMVVLKPGGLAAGTVIYITDRGWDGPNNIWLDEAYPPFTFGIGSEAVIKWVVPAGGIIQGKEVFFIGKYHDELPAGSEYYQWFAYSDEAGTIPLGAITNETPIVPTALPPPNGFTDGMSLFNAGDNILIFQTGPPAGPATNYNDATRRFITAILANIRPTNVGTPTSYAAWDVAPNVQNESSIPPGLVNGQTCFLMSPGPLPHPTSPVPGTVEPDNGKFSNCALSLAGTCTAAQMAAVIYNITNWTYQNTVFAVGTSSSQCTYNILSTNTATLSSGVGTNTQTVNVGTPITNITYNTTSATGATFSGLPTGVTGNWASNVVTISGTPTTAVGSPFNYTVTLTGGCAGTNPTGTITVTCPTITVTNPGVTTGTINSFFSQTFTATGGTGPYTFTTVSPLPAGITLSTAGILSGTPTASGTFNIVVTATDANLCAGNGANYPLVINTCGATAIATPSSQTICSGTAITTIVFTGTGTTFNWTRDNTVAVTGIAASGSGNISGTLTNTTAAPVTVTFTITPNDGTCNGAPITATVVVIPIPTVNTVANQTICNNTATTAVNFTGAVSGTTYNWTNDNATIGLAASGIGDIASFTATNPGIAPVVATVTVTPVTTASSLPTPEVLYYKFEGSGTSVPNLASAPPPGTANATIMGGVTQGGSAICGGTLIGTGVSSTTDFLNTNWAPNLGTASWTISFKSENITPSATLFYIFGDINTTSFRCFTNGVAGANNWILRGAGLTDILISGGATVAPHTNTFVYDATLNNVKAYLDGVLVNTVAQTAPNITGTGPFKVMGYSTNVGSPLNGHLDEYRIYSRALTATEVASIAACPTSGPACTGTPTTYTYTVNPNNTVNLTSASGTDAQTVPVNTPITNITYATTGATGATVTGLPAGVTGAWAANVVTIMGSPTTIVGSPFTYTVTLTGGCGTVTATGTLTVIPCTIPTITCPGNISLNNTTGQCSRVVTYTTTATGTPAPTLTYSFTGATIASGSGDGSGSLFNVGVTNVSVTATNACGSPSCSFSVTITDNQPPTITCPGPVTVSCVSAVPAVNIASVTGVSDNCAGLVTVTHMGDVISGQTCANRYTITRTYRATDAATNFTECTQIITVNDQTPPVLTCPAAITVSCAAAVPAVNVAAVTGVSDNCGGTVTVTFIGDVISAQTCANRFTITRTYRATDVCGNFAECTQIITVNDVTPPTLTCPAAVTVSCASAVPAVNIAAVTGVSDNCGGAVTVTFIGDVISAQTCANRFTITRTYRATDVCGNFAECTQIITVNDITPPVMTCPAAVTVSCAAAVPAVNIAAVTGVSDNCAGVVTITHIGDVISGQTCANRFTVTRTYRATDVCGNFAECTQIITVNDITPPVMTCPAAVTVSCAAAVPAVNIASVTGVSDNCAGVVTITHIGDVISGQTCANRFTVTRTYRATDVCGNFAECTQIITVNDITAPVITCSPNLTAVTPVGFCTAVVNFTITATDNCAGAVTIVSSPASGTAFPIGTTTVTSTATDVCGNSSSCTFTVTVTDGQLPTITAQPVNRTVCAGSSATFNVTAVTTPNAGGPIAYQWQQWNGSAWVNVTTGTGATTSALTLTNVSNLPQNTNTFRVVLTGLCSIVNSNAATLYVNPLPTISLAASIPPNLLPGQTLSITATVNPGGGSFVWFKNGVVVPGVTGAVLSGLTVDNLGTYKVVYTDPNGCVSTSADVTLTGQPSNNLYVYPNPNTGVFQVRFYNTVNEAASVIIYNERGQRGYVQKFTTGTPYSSINIDISRSPAGIYIVEVVNAAGKRIAAKRIVKQL